jgi:hypothetical protein
MAPVLIKDLTNTRTQMHMCGFFLSKKDDGNRQLGNLHYAGLEWAGPYDI